MLLLGIIVGCSARQEPEQKLPTVTETVSQVTDATSTPRPQATPTPVPTKPIQEESVSHTIPSPTPDSPPVRLVIPALGIDVPVVEVGWYIVGEGKERRSEWQTADYAAGHHVNSANPGQVGNVVISGHHNIKGKVFEQISRDIDREKPRLIPGAKIQVYTADGRDYTYRVEQVLLLQEVGASEEERRKNAQWMAPTDEPSLTLITCWPFWTNTHRVIVRAKLQE